MLLSAKATAVLRGVADAELPERVLEPHQTETDRAVAQVRGARLRDGVVVEVDHVVEHAHGDAHRLPQSVVVDALGADVGGEVDRAEVADGDLVPAGVEQDLGAEVRVVDDPGVVLRAAHVGRVLEGDPGVAGLEERGQHRSPEIDGAQPSGVGDLAPVDRGFVLGVAPGEGRAVEIVQVGDVARAEEGPVAVGLHPLHEEVGHPERRCACRGCGGGRRRCSCAGRGTPRRRGARPRGRRRRRPCACRPD